MTLSALLPYLLVAGGYLLRHYQVPGKLLAILGNANPFVIPPASPSSTPSVPPPPVIPAGARPALSNAVNAAIQQAARDAVAGHVSSLRDEIRAMAKAAIQEAVLSNTAPKS